MTDDTESGELQPRDGLTDLQREGARLAAEGWLGKQIARELEVAPETVSRWRKIPAFNRAILNHHEYAAIATRARLVQLIETAIDELEELVTYRHDASIRLRAAKCVLEVAGVQRVMRAAANSDDE